MKRKLSPISVFLLGLLFVHSCAKENPAPIIEVEELPNHYEITNEKIKNYDPGAFVGEWESLVTTTWNPQDEYSHDSTRVNLTITPTHWVTEGKSIPYTVTYDIWCQYLIVDVIFHTDQGDISAHCQESGWGNHMRITTFEYPEDPDVFRIDRTYAPVGYVD